MVEKLRGLLREDSIRRGLQKSLSSLAGGRAERECVCLCTHRTERVVVPLQYTHIRTPPSPLIPSSLLKAGTLIMGCMQGGSCLSNRLSRVL